MNIIKKWILNRPFIKHALLEAEIKAFPKAHKDILETMKDDLNEKAEILAQEIVAGMLSNVDLSKIVTIDKIKGIVYIGGEAVSEDRLANLKAEAGFLMESDIWALLHETPKELSQRALFLEGDNIESQGKKGRAILYTLSTQKNIVETFKNLKTNK